jgi:hypothetical protein
MTNKQKLIKLSETFEIEAIEYASQGNAILGIRDSGKSYTATSIAEKLYDSSIPFIAFDPIGVWRNLKIGAKGHGYPVVVAGENADLELSVESAPRIVRAAMKSNISLVLDLYSMKLSKADWRRIVQECIQLLLYENKPCGLRHIFLEEAAEFCPQRVGPESGRVYAEIEKLARMGGNASLGYTLINQRAEEVNKAVLELCDCLFLHRQKGRHSLTALGKWLDVADAEDSRGVVKSLPTLTQGECWVWQQGSQKPLKIKVLPKNTLHPDRRHPLAVTKGMMTDVSAFVSRLKSSLQAEPKVEKLAPPTRHNHEERKEMVAQDTGELDRLRGELHRERSKAEALEKIIEGLKKALKPQYDALRSVFDKLDDIPTGASDDSWNVWLEKLQGKNREMLQVLIESKSLTRQQLAFRTGMSPNSGTFATYLSRLKSLGLTRKNGDQIELRS